MILKSKAIVLRSLKFGDSSLIIDMFTELEGRVSFITRIPKTTKGKIKKQYFQLFILLLLNLTILLFLSEFLYSVTRGEQQNAHYIIMCMQVWNDWMNQNTFMIRLSCFVSFFPNLNAYQKDVYFDF